MSALFPLPHDNPEIKEITVQIMVNHESVSVGD